ncbi:hypothetical protein TRIUR3_00676 [Triticum urartu]|uniref:Uncharacterized protein n=1 Tax=Triticum urartu TaxID=4572 RepID=M7Z0P0_TRIUA|nr:hypothetical protein TRIUR3_00676 [Triticum urartu]
MHGRLHPASISTRAAATPGGARAAAVVHGAGVGRRSVGRRDGRLRPSFALPSIHPSDQSARPRLRPLTHALVSGYLLGLLAGDLTITNPSAGYQALL